MRRTQVMQMLVDAKFVSLEVQISMGYCAGATEAIG